MSTRGPIICLEGPSAVGKSTVARCLAERHGYQVIPEVNVLFQNEKRESDDWYLQRQIDRYARSIALATSGRAVILDGDPFQPLWYNWVYPEYGPLAHVTAFYREAINAGAIAFPDRYVVLQAPTDHLAARKTGDDMRRRHNFDRHLQMVEPQRRYFEQFGAQGFTRVEFIDNVDAEDTALRIANMVLNAEAATESARLLSIMADWLGRNHPKKVLNDG